MMKSIPKLPRDADATVPGSDTPLADDFYEPLPRLPPETEMKKLVRQLEWARRKVDARLTRPARWSGPIRRETFRGRPRERERSSVAQTFDHLAAQATCTRSPEVGAALLSEVHQRVAHGRAYREQTLFVGRHGRFPPAASVPELVDALCSRLERSKAPPVIVSARAHLALVNIHPFLDGNGRSARLISSFVLLRAGFRSTLFTAVEQHFSFNPPEYFRVLDRYRFGAVRFDDCVRSFVRAMLVSAWYAAWSRARAARFDRACAELGVPASERDRHVREFDLGTGSVQLRARLGEAVLPWRILERRLPDEERRMLLLQTERLRAEEAADLGDGTLLHASPASPSFAAG